ncbi:MAG: RibD family protein [Acidobacteria bacterium]|nr:RibD family protein [Acidobacteriota bacterium]
MTRPHVICHMGPSVDGRIVTGRWSVSRALSAAYEETAATFGADAWIIGRVSMEPYAGNAEVPGRDHGEPIPRVDFIDRDDADSYAIAIDPSGKLRWESNMIDEEHVITILTESVDDDYLAFLQSKGVSYLFGGRERIDLPMVLQKLADTFDIQTLLLEGGGNINGTFLEADCIDELSLLIAPVADGATNVATLFDAGESTPARPLELISVEQREDSIVWIRYKVKR